MTMKTYIYGVVLEHVGTGTLSMYHLLGHTQAVSEDEARGVAVRKATEKQPGCHVVHVGIIEFLPESAE
jgi:hypothetical protein